MADASCACLRFPLAAITAVRSLVATPLLQVTIQYFLPHVTIQHLLPHVASLLHVTIQQHFLLRVTVHQPPWWHHTTTLLTPAFRVRAGRARSGCRSVALDPILWRRRTFGIGTTSTLKCAGRPQLVSWRCGALAINPGGPNVSKVALASCLGEAWGKRRGGLGGVWALLKGSGWV
jgi:hypothetical protein